MVSSRSRFLTRLALAALLLMVTSHGFGLHHHDGGEVHPESCAFCRAAAMPMAATPLAEWVTPAPLYLREAPAPAVVPPDRPRTPTLGRAPPSSLD